MLLFGKYDAAARNPSPVLADPQSREDQRDLDQSIKDLTSAEKAHDKSVKAAFDAHRAVDQAIENEYETAKALNRATHNHDVAISNEHNARITAKINQQYEAHLQRGLEQKRRRLDEVHQRKANNDKLRKLDVSQDNVHTATTVIPDEGRATSGHRDCLGDAVSAVETAALANMGNGVEDAATA
ncbi:hypothetical protein VTO73DRAFT_2561 [Trametes versicolor]